MSTFTVRFEMYGDLVVEAETSQDADRFAADSLIRWSGHGTDAQDVQIDGVTVHGVMTEAAS